MARTCGWHARWAAGLAHTPLVGCSLGAGYVIVTGLCLAERIGDTPVARELLWRMANVPLNGDAGRTLELDDPDLEACLSSVGCLAEQEGDVIVRDGAMLPADKDLPSRLAAGATLLINGLTPETVADWALLLELDLEARPDERCNVARCVTDGLLGNITNWDLCWVDRDTAQPIVRHTLSVSGTQARTLVETTATNWRGYQTAHEQMKVAMMLRRMRDFEAPRAAVVEIQRGAGRIILNQLCLSEAAGPFESRARRILTSWLDHLGVKRDLTVSPLTPRPHAICRPDGYIAQWAVLGPFAEAPGHPLDHAFIDEAASEPVTAADHADETWQVAASAFAHMDLSGVFETLPERDHVAYAALEVYSAQDRSVLLDAPDMVGFLTGADGGVKVWLNGREIGRFDFVRELVLDNDHVPGVPLRQGWNSLLVKLHNPSGAWRFAARFQNAAGEPVSDLQYRLPAAANAAVV